VDVRIVAATNRDLRKAIEQGDFREDLFFRLNVLEVVSPPLRERIDDIPLLVSRLVDKLSRKNRKEVRSVSPEFLDALMAYHWPGNVRELENVLERALILSRSDILGPESLPAQLLQVEERRDPLPQRMVSTALVPSFDDAERETLLKALEAHNGHREKTADALGISRRTLQYKLKKFGLTRRS
jgi:two-component system NtrC family response regulator